MPKAVKVMEVLAESESVKNGAPYSTALCREFRCGGRQWKDYDLQNQRKNFIRSGADSLRLNRSGEGAAVHGQPSTVAFAPTLIL